MENADSYETREDGLDEFIPNQVIKYLNLSGSVDISYESDASLEPPSSSKWEEANEEKSSTDYALEALPFPDNGSDGSLEWGCEVNTAYNCGYCKRPYEQPRLLECLHSFCERCITLMLENKSDKNLSAPLEEHRNESKTPPGVVKCPTCRQATNIGNDLRWVKYLKPDFVKANVVSSADFKRMTLSCESCKAEEPALARCMECACFLCVNCINAHRYMKCFDGHEVVSFEELKTGNDNFVVHRPVFCQDHYGELLKYCCITCNEVICVQCARLIHSSKEHCVEMLRSEHADPVREQLQDLCYVAQSKEEILQSAASDVDERVQCLRDNVEAVRSEIEEHYNFCLEAVRSARDNVLQQLDKTEANTEGRIMENFRKVRNTMEKISDACVFTKQLLKHGSALELLISRKVVSSQLLQLAHSIPNLNVSPSIAFVRDTESCESAFARLFGTITVDTNESASTELTASAQLGGLFKPASLEATVQSQQSNKPTSFDTSQRTSPSAISPHPDLLTDGQFVHCVRSSPDSVSRPLLMNGMPSTSSSNHLNAFVLPNKLVKSANGNIPNQSNRDCLPIEVLSTAGQDEVAPSDNFPCFMTPSEFCLRFLAGQQNSASNLYRSSSTMVEREVGNNNRPYGIGDGVGAAPCANSMATFNLPSALPVNQSEMYAFTGPLNEQSPQFKADLMTSPPARTWKVPLAEVRSRFGTNGRGFGQFDSPHGFCISNEDELIVADSNNHRIQVLSKMGQYIYQFGVPGRDDGHLWYPRKVVLSRSNDFLIVCDRGTERSRMQFFSRNGTFLRSIQIHFVEIVAGLAVDEDDTIVVVDSVKPTVYCIGHGGEVSRWFSCQHMLEPSDLAISHREYFICDFKGHAVYVFTSTGSIIRRIGGPLVTPFPNGICISQDGHVLIGDSHGNRFHIAVFQPTGNYVTERECSSVKVSRCSGLQFTKEGWIVTLVKNNHCVLILNPLN